MTKRAVVPRNRWRWVRLSLFAMISVLVRIPFDIASAGAGLKPAKTAAAQEPHTGQPAVVKRVADDLYFFYDYDGSNSVFLVTDAGVLVIDTREHPRAAEDLLSRIRKVTDKPIKWVEPDRLAAPADRGDARLARVAVRAPPLAGARPGRAAREHLIEAAAWSGSGRPGGS